VVGKSALTNGSNVPFFPWLQEAAAASSKVRSFDNWPDESQLRNNSVRAPATRFIGVQDRQ